jgi:hypothetical protein
MTQHLDQLSKLLGRTVNVTDLLSLDDTAALRARSAPLAALPHTRYVLPFSEKNGDRFQQLVQRLDDAQPAGVYVWTQLSNTCGLIAPIRLAAIEWEFDFDVLSEGIVSFVGADVEDRLLLDFYENDTGQSVMELELAGTRWGTLAY